MFILGMFCGSVITLLILGGICYLSNLANRAIAEYFDETER
jgi:hypothetical protein